MVDGTIEWRQTLVNHMNNLQGQWLWTLVDCDASSL
jgi:hypothetical protein